MLKSLVDRLSEAIDDGEVLTVTYSGGSSPGCKRKILPIRIAHHLVYARESSSLIVKSFYIDRLAIVDDDFSAPWLEEQRNTRQRATIIEDPVRYFSSWAYQIHKSLWPALGVTLREYIDKKKPAQKDATTKHDQGGISVTNKTPTKYLAYAISTPPAFDFQEGDLFFSSTSTQLALQVIAKRKLIEVHQIKLGNNRLSDATCRAAFQLIDTELADWLRTGIVPAHACIDASQSYSDVLRFSIASQLCGDFQR